jgi:methanogenic corrinoid protein MtbC1
MVIANQQLTNNKFVELLISGNYSKCSEFVHDNLKVNTIPELYENIIKKALYEIGELWETNKISVATEHLASSIVEAILNELYGQIISAERNTKKVIGACVENEFHQIGIKMITDVFEMNGWNAYIIGANTPTKELISFTNRVKPDILAISLSLYFNLPILENMLQKFRNEFPDLTILVGGQAFLRGGHDVVLKYDNVVYVPDIQSLQSFIKN